MNERAVRAIGSVLVALATVLVLLAVAILPFLTPAWIGFAQDRAEAAAWTGFSPEQLRQATNGILADLILGPPDFDVALDGVPVLSAIERSHMRDVREVFMAFGAVVLATAAFLVAAAAWTRRSAAFWRAVRGGALGLLVGVVVLGAIGFLAFDAAFRVFHLIFFAGGNWAFDPRTARIVQLFPQRFWFETSISVGVVAGVLALATAAVAHRRIGRVAMSPSVAHPSFEAT